MAWPVLYFKTSNTKTLIIFVTTAFPLNYQHHVYLPNNLQS